MAQQNLTKLRSPGSQVIVAFFGNFPPVPSLKYGHCHAKLITAVFHMYGAITSTKEKLSLSRKEIQPSGGPAGFPYRRGKLH